MPEVKPREPYRSCVERSKDPLFKGALFYLFKPLYKKSPRLTFIKESIEQLRLCRSLLALKSPKPYGLLPMKAVRLKHMQLLRN